MNPAPHQKAIRQVIRQRNPFHANPILKLRRRGWQRLWYHPRTRNYLLRLARFIFHASEKISKYVVITTTLFVGFILAAIITLMPVVIAFYLLNFNLTEAGLHLVTEQSWRNYSSWILISSTLFCLPYWWWGLPLALSLRYYHPLHRWYRRRRLRTQLQAIHYDDPAYLSAQIARHPLMTCPVRPSQKMAQWIETSGKIIGTITGTLAALLCLFLFIKLLPFLWKSGDTGQSIAIFLGCPATIYLPFLLFRAYHSGQAVADLVIDLFNGNSFREAIVDALADFCEQLFEGG